MWPGKDLYFPRNPTLPRPCLRTQKLKNCPEFHVPSTICCAEVEGGRRGVCSPLWSSVLECWSVVRGERKLSLVRASSGSSKPVGSV